MKSKIYIFLNQIVDKIAQYAAVAEDGACLGWCNLSIVHGYSARFKLGENSPFAKQYALYYPLGYELIVIENINAYENTELLRHLRTVTIEHVRKHTKAQNN